MHGKQFLHLISAFVCSYSRTTRAQGTQESRGSPEQDRQLPKRPSDVQWRWIESSQLLVKTLGEAPRTAHTMYPRSAAYLLPKTRRPSPSASNNWQTFPRHPAFLSPDSTVGWHLKELPKKKKTLFRVRRGRFLNRVIIIISGNICKLRRRIEQHYPIMCHEEDKR